MHSWRGAWLYSGSRCLLRNAISTLRGIRNNLARWRESSL